MPFRNRFQSDLDTAVADATGEDLRTIRRMGFSPIDLQDHDFDPEPDIRAPFVFDWDTFDLSRGECVSEQSLSAYRWVA